MRKGIKVKQKKENRRRIRVRAKITGTALRPRLNVFRSLNHINAQLIDDQSGKTLLSANDLKLKAKKATKTDKAKEVGKMIAKLALEKNIKIVVFDRSIYKYHGRIKAVADGAREGGLEF